MFGFSYTEGGPWNDDGIKAITKFLDRIERLAIKLSSLKPNKNNSIAKDEKELLYATNFAIKAVDYDMDNFSFNTAVARLMELLNALYKYDLVANKNVALFKQCFTNFVLLLAPCAPHFSEEIWSMLGNKNSIFLSEYPVYDEKALVKDEIELAVQINSRIKSKIIVSTSASQDEIRKIACNDKKIAEEIAEKQIVKIILVPNRLINIIVK